MKTVKILVILVVAMCLLVWLERVSLAKKPMGNGFTYHGKLKDKDTGQPLHGYYDFICVLWDDPCAIDDPNVVGDIVEVNELEVKGGQFRLILDFGSDPNIFNGDARWLEIGVREGELEDPNVYDYLEPRTELSPAPYAVNAVRISGEKVVKNEHLGDGAVGKEKIENGAVEKEKIKNGAVSKEKIENDAVDKDKIRDRAVDPNKIERKAVKAEHLEEGAVEPNKIALGAVDANKLGDISGYVLETSYDLGPVVTLINTDYGNEDPILHLENFGSKGMALEAIMHGSAGMDEKPVIYGQHKEIGAGVYGHSDGGKGVHGRSDGNEDISCGVYGENTAGGWAGYFAGKTYIGGQITISGGSPGPGKVLTCENSAEGRASWQTPVGIVPIGGVVAWLKSFENTPSLPENFVECNGQTLDDTESPYHGQVIPNLNQNPEDERRFLRGAPTSGGTGGSSETEPTTDFTGKSNGSGEAASRFHTHSFTPPYYEVVWIMRVK